MILTNWVVPLDTFVSKLYDSWRNTMPTTASQIQAFSLPKRLASPIQYGHFAIIRIINNSLYQHIFCTLSNYIILGIVRQWLSVCTRELLIMAPSRETSHCYWIKIMKLGSNCCGFCSCYLPDEVTDLQITLRFGVGFFVFLFCLKSEIYFT